MAKGLQVFNSQDNRNKVNQSIYGGTERLQLEEDSHKSTSRLRYWIRNGETISTQALILEVFNKKRGLKVRESDTLKCKDNDNKVYYTESR